MILSKELLEMMTRVFDDLDEIMSDLQKEQEFRDNMILKLKLAYGVLNEQKLKLQELRRLAGENIH